MQSFRKHCPQLVSLSLGETQRLSSKSFLSRLALADGKRVHAHWHACEEGLVTTLLFPFPPPSGWQLTWFSKHVIHFFLSAGCSTQWFSETAAFYAWTQESAGPSNLGTKAVRTGLAAQSHVTRTTCSFIGPSRIFQKQFCIVSTNPYFYCWFENKRTATSCYFFLIWLGTSI